MPSNEDTGFRTAADQDGGVQRREHQEMDPAGSTSSIEPNRERSPGRGSALAEGNQSLTTGGVGEHREMATAASASMYQARLEFPAATTRRAYGAVDLPTKRIERGFVDHRRYHGLRTSELHGEGEGHGTDRASRMGQLSPPHR